MGVASAARVDSAPTSPAAATRPLRILRVIARMNLGGPAHHVSLLTRGLDERGHETLLVAGRVGSGEAPAEEVAGRYGIHAHTLDSLGPELRPGADARSLAELRAIVRRFRPDVVHTHTAKAGLVGRLAALTAVRPHPLLVHTFHGHVLEGYFGRAQTALYRGLERGLAHASDCLIGVSQATVDDLVRLGVAPREKFRVVPLGLALDRFLALDPAAQGPLRDEVGAAPGDVVATFVGRLVPIKRVDRILRALAAARDAGAPLVLAVVGDGEQRPALERLAGELGVAPAVRFLGYREDLPAIAAGTDIAVLASDNEGTPVWLIEAAAAGVPAVSTRVGGVPEVVAPGCGTLVEPTDEFGLGRALAALAADEDGRREAGARARAHVRERYAADRLVADVDALYAALDRRRREAAAR